MQYKAVLFDMDGTLVDSEEHNLIAAIELFKRHGYTVTAEDFEPFVGGGALKYIGGVAKKYDIEFSSIEDAKAELYEIYDEVVKGEVLPVKGSHALIQQCKEKGMKVAVATSADWIKLTSNLREFGMDAESFDAIVQGLEIKNKKPHPETFLKAANKLGLSPKECIVFEDAVNGVESAKAGGFTCVGVMTSFSDKQLEKANFHVKDLSEVTPEMMGWE